MRDTKRGQFSEEMLGLSLQASSKTSQYQTQHTPISHTYTHLPRWNETVQKASRDLYTLFSKLWDGLRQWTQDEVEQYKTTKWSGQRTELTSTLWVTWYHYMFALSSDKSSSLQHKAMDKSNQQGVLEKSWALLILRPRAETVTAARRDS